MNDILSASLGLDDVPADPNWLPNGKWDGIIAESQYVLVQKKDQLSHVVTYEVTEGPKKSARRQVWYTLGEQPRDKDGNWPEKVSDVAEYVANMGYDLVTEGSVNGKTLDERKANYERSRSYYKKLFVDLGVPEEEVSKTPPEALIAKPVTFGTRQNGNFINVNFVQLRNPNDSSSQESSVPSGDEAPASLPDF